jgi:hypothetical protein
LDGESGMIDGLRWVPVSGEKSKVGIVRGILPVPGKPLGNQYLPFKLQYLDLSGFWRDVEVVE